MKDIKELSRNQLRVVSWLTTAENQREPKTIEELAEEIGVRPATIQRWRSRRLDAVAAEEIRMKLFEHLPQIYETVAEKAEGGSPEHIGLFLKIANAAPSEPADLMCTDTKPSRGKGDDRE